MNRQEIFDKISKHLLTQNLRSANGRRCYYRSPEGLKCALGALIPDEKYDQKLEGQSAYSVEVLKAIGLGKTSREDKDFLRKLQEIHDHSEPDEWAWRLRMFAERYNLIFSIEKEFLT